MKRFLGILAVVAGLLGALLMAGLTYFTAKYPDVDPAPSIAVERTPARLERGKYLANHVAVCMDCHSTRDWQKFAGPIIPGTEGKGGDEFNRESAHVPGVLFASNITPAGIGDYTDGELLRTFTTGVTKHNRPLFPLMGYYGYNKLTQEDAYSIIAYIRTLQPIENVVGESRLDFPLNLIVKTMPLKSYIPSAEVNRSDTVAFGKYVATIAGCGDCHTPMKEGQPVPGMEYAGGFEFGFPGGTVRSANITPDNETGIGEMKREDFIARFRLYAGEEGSNMQVALTDFNTPMPWTMYAGMTDDDLSAIYSYLRTIKPVKRVVEKFTPRASAASD